jgi:hypothetical protein
MTGQPLNVSQTLMETRFGPSSRTASHPMPAVTRRPTSRLQVSTMPALSQVLTQVEFDSD